MTKKEPISQSEFNDLIRQLKELKNPERVPVFNNDWKEFTEEQKKELRGYIRGSGEFEKKLHDFITHIL